MKWDPVKHALPFWEKEKGGGPITDILRRREKDKGKKGYTLKRAAIFPCDGNHWRSYRRSRDD